MRNKDKGLVMFVSEFQENELVKETYKDTKHLLLNLLEKLGYTDDQIMINIRNDNILTIVFKVKAMYERSNSSHSNIVTIRVHDNYLGIGPYMNNNENTVDCNTEDAINIKLINTIKSIYQEKYAKEMARGISKKAPR